MSRRLIRFGLFAACAVLVVASLGGCGKVETGTAPATGGAKADPTLEEFLAARSALARQAGIFEVPQSVAPVSRGP